MKKIGLIFAGIAFFALVILLTQVLWNNLIPELFHGPVISYWQALGLLILGKLLFGWHSHAGKFNNWRQRKEWKERMASMTPEQREKMRERFRRYCDPRRFDWQEEEFENRKGNPGETSQENKEI